MMMRNWFISWLGLTKLAPALAEISRRLKALEADIDALKAEIAALKTLRTFREETKPKISALDWEQIQAEYLANQQNFKEN